MLACSNHAERTVLCAGLAASCGAVQTAGACSATTRPQDYQSQKNPCRSLCGCGQTSCSVRQSCCPLSVMQMQTGGMPSWLGSIAGRGLQGRWSAPVHARRRSAALSSSVTTTSSALAKQHAPAHSPLSTARTCKSVMQVEACAREVVCCGTACGQSRSQACQSGLPYSVSQGAEALALAPVNVNVTAAPRARAQARAAPRAARRGARGWRCARPALRPARSPAAPGQTPLRSARRAALGSGSYARRTAT